MNGINVQLLTLGGVCAALAIVPWIHIGRGGGKDDGWAPRLTSWLLAASAAAFALAIPEWRDALAGATAGAAGVGKLTVVLIASGLCFWFQAVHRRRDSGGLLSKMFRKKGAPEAALQPRHRRHHYDRVRTMAVSGVFGTAFVLAWARGKQVVHEIVSSPAKYQTALGQYSQQVRNGSAVHAMTKSQEHHVLWVAALIGVVLFFAMRGYERKRRGLPVLLPAKKKAKGGGGQPAVGGGGGGRAALPPGMGR